MHRQPTPSPRPTSTPARSTTPPTSTRPRPRTRPSTTTTARPSSCPRSGPSASTRKAASTRRDGARRSGQPGRPISYTFDLENTGNVTLTGVTVTDPSVDRRPARPRPATLDPGRPPRAPPPTPSTQADIDAGEVDNTADVDADRAPGPGRQRRRQRDRRRPAGRTISIDKAGSLDLGLDGAGRRAGRDHQLHLRPRPTPAT